MWKKNGFRILTVLLEVLVIIILAIVLFYTGMLDSSELFNFAFISSIVFYFLIQTLTAITRSYFEKRHEESNKLQQNNETLVNQYFGEKFIEYTNSEKAIKSMKSLSAYKKYFYQKKRKGWNREHIIIPTIELYTKNNVNSFEFIHTDHNYKVPKIVSKNYSKILEAHNTSDLENGIMVRVDDLTTDDKTLIMKWNRTTYYNSMVTNRAADYEWESNMTVRNCLEPGYKFSELSQSKLSNHIGVNVVLETTEEDGSSYLAFIKRSQRNTISKRMLGVGVSAALKSKYLFANIDDNKNLCDPNYTNEPISKLEVKNFEYAIQQEIKDELNLSPETPIEITFEANFLGMYRDVVEAGKPNYLFMYKIKLSRDEINKNLKPIKEKENRKTDGKKIYYINKANLKDTYITDNRILIDKKLRKISPSAVASLVMYMKLKCHLDTSNE